MKNLPLRKPCLVCGSIIEKKSTKSLKDWNERVKFCSRKCMGYNASQNPKQIKSRFSKERGYVPPTAFKEGIRNNPDGEFRSDDLTGEKNVNWKGDDVGYHALHGWIARQYGKADHCEKCGCDQIPKGRQRWFDWANLSHEYKRDVSDWMMMCKPCHREYDKTHMAYKKKPMKKSAKKPMKKSKKC